MSRILRTFSNSLRSPPNFSDHASTSSALSLSMHPDMYNVQAHKDFNMQEFQITNIEQYLHNWTIPKEPKKNIYQIGLFDK